MIIDETTKSFVPNFRVPDPAVYVPTVCDNYSMQVIVDDRQPVSLNLWDTAGQGRNSIDMLGYLQNHTLITL